MKGLCFFIYREVLKIIADEALQQIKKNARKQKLTVPNAL